ncbi:YaiI/YqxD family protein [Enterovibrio paralichthyis]|uniref:YaiI/YqxD family protein n=1 Tax=Enterovibrio paralichthyis TaxID=2853805 RepID=UPI001C44E682|nr:YaiI/YqxD family protein [Enterovibrio paralichthyis]MBV7300464.1 YaiI/YqxD family protein [Enterovibrio paralichthyis]
MTTIWVDADACPAVIKEVLYRAAERTQTDVVFVANQALRTPPSRFIKRLQVEKGFDVADNEIVKRVEKNDLVVTADIPLASEVIDKAAVALNPRGELYTPENIRQRLNMRDFMETMRSSGIQTGGPAALNQQDRQKFANELDKFLQRAKRAG